MINPLKHCMQIWKVMFCKYIILHSLANQRNISSNLASFTLMTQCMWTNDNMFWNKTCCFFVPCIIYINMSILKSNVSQCFTLNERRQQSKAILNQLYQLGYKNDKTEKSTAFHLHLPLHFCSKLNNAFGFLY